MLDILTFSFFCIFCKFLGWKKKYHNLKFTYAENRCDVGHLLNTREVSKEPF